MVWIFALLFAVVRIESASVASCGDQYGCLKVDVSEPTDDDQYEICLYWDSTLASCDKSSAISHACSSQDKDDKIENFESGRDSAMCDVVDCGDNAIFGLKDGKGCGSSSGLFGFSGVSGIYCQGSGGDNGYCGGGNTKECMWVVPAPECAATTTTSTTTTEEPYRTASTSTTSTTASSSSTTSAPSDEMATTADDDEAETTTTESATTTEAVPMTTVDCKVWDEGCSEFDNPELCEDLNPMIVACRWNEDGVIGKCELDVCGSLPVSSCVACGCRYEEAVGCYPDPTDTSQSVRIRQDAYDVSDAQIENGMDNDDAAKPAVSQWVYVEVAAGAAILLGVMVAAAVYCVWKKTNKQGFHAANVNEPDADIENANEGLDHELDVEDQLIIDTAQSAETS